MKLYLISIFTLPLTALYTYTIVNPPEITVACTYDFQKDNFSKLAEKNELHEFSKEIIDK